MDILTQSLAIQKAMSSLSKLILENHLRTYLVGLLDTDKKADQERVITELLGLYELYNIRGNRDD